MDAHTILQMMINIRSVQKLHNDLTKVYMQNNQPERSKREDPLPWQPPKEECFHNYSENTDSYRYYFKRGCRCKRDAVL